MPPKASPHITLLLDMLGEAYVNKAWHGTNLRGSLRGMKAQQAAWRPDPARHNVWEVVVHCAYWKYVIHRRITGAKRGSFPLKGSNWFTRPVGPISEDDWRQDVELLDTMHELLHEAVAGLKPARLTSLSPKKQFTLIQEIYGMTMHDVYHTGQIQLLKRLMKK